VLVKLALPMAFALTMKPLSDAVYHPLAGNGRAKPVTPAGRLMFAQSELWPGDDERVTLTNTLCGVFLQCPMGGQR
jgi:hypothetical protein